MASLPRDILFAGIRGHVVALDKGTGSERWRTRLKGTDFVHVVSDGSRLYASTRGEVFALDPSTGSILWRNAMKGLGFGLASLVSGPNNDAESSALLDHAARVAAQRRSAAAAAG